MSRVRATSLERCQFPSRSDRSIERLCSPERSTMARWNVCWSMGRILHQACATRPELYQSWSSEFISCPPEFSRAIIVCRNEQFDEDRSRESEENSGRVRGHVRDGGEADFPQ